MEKSKKILVSIAGVLIFGGSCLGCFYLGKNSNEKVNTSNKNEPTIDIVKSTKEQSLNIKNSSDILGKVIVKNDGTAYFVNTENKNLKINKQYNIGTKSNYEFGSGLVEMCETDLCKSEAYKLDIENVVGAYAAQFGNSGEPGSALLLTKDGHVHELYIKGNFNDNNIDLELHKDVFTTTKILTILESCGVFGCGATLVDLEGKQYQYYGFDNGAKALNAEQSVNIVNMKDLLGKVIVKNDGTAYFVNIENKNLKINKQYNIGTKGIHNFGTGVIESCDKKECKSEAYKLDIENVVGAYAAQFGNSGEPGSALLLTKDGHVHELYIKGNFNDSNIDLELHKDVFTTTKILTILESCGVFGCGATLVDLEGKQYQYYGFDNLK